MNMNDTIDSLVSNSNNIISIRQRMQKIELYAEGLKAKLSQIEYSLNKLKEFENMSDHRRTSTIPSEFTITDKVYFYCDTFWTYLYSSLDVLSQLVNQTLQLNLKEKDVSFKLVNNALKSKMNGSKLQKVYETCKNSKAFKNIENYRNCSTHRRQIYINEDINIVTHTPGYSINATGDVETVIRTICDNPLDLNPKIDQKRKIPDYLEKTKDRIMSFIIQILKKTKPVK